MTNKKAEMVILGGGSWGTALSLHLARAGQRVKLWVHDAGLAEGMRVERVNNKYLPGHTLPEDIEITSELAEALQDQAEVLLAVPSHCCREVLESARPLLKRLTILTVASKGIENASLMRVSEIARQVLGGEPATAVLSGPSFAQEVASGHPTALVVACADTVIARHLQKRLSTDRLRIYTTADTIGVELGGAVKNVIAIGAGVIEGLGYGSNTLAALITRGLAEMSCLAESLGGRRETLSGLAGLGDLVLTCTGALSRNRQLGVGLGQGRSLVECQGRTPMVAEGVRTALSAHELARRQGIEMPITEKVHALLYRSKPAREAIRELLARQLKSEGP